MKTMVRFLDWMGRAFAVAVFLGILFVVFDLSFGQDVYKTEYTKHIVTKILYLTTAKAEFYSAGSGEQIFSSTADQLDIDATTEIEITTTTVDVNADVDVSGAVYPAAANGAALGSATNEWADLFLADGAVINLGVDQDVTLTHVADVGVTLDGNLTVNDSLKVGGGTQVWKIIKSGTTLLFITAADTFVVDSVRAK